MTTRFGVMQMSSLKTLDRDPFETLLGMSGGYVLDFTNPTFAAFFRETVGIDIYSAKYEFIGDSKAKRLRGFWEVESDPLVGKVLSELLEYWSYKNPAPDPADKARFERCQSIVAKLLGRQVTQKDSEAQFLDRDLSGVSLSQLKIDQTILPILEARFAEAKRCMQAEAPLAAIFLCGSILEGVLLGVACANPRDFNQAPNSPKDAVGKVRPFPEWTLAQLIDVACELGHLKLDVKKFSHALRDFRNFIHPFQQMTSRFNPDRHTADICLQVLKAGIASLSGQRN